jgi:hypothetical protein
MNGQIYEVFSSFIKAEDYVLEHDEFGEYGIMQVDVK